MQVWSDVRTFKTETPNQQEVKIATYGDMLATPPPPFPLFFVLTLVFFQGCLRADGL